MRMITLFLPEHTIHAFDTLVTEGKFPNRSEGLRFALWLYLHEINKENGDKNDKEKK